MKTARIVLFVVAAAIVIVAGIGWVNAAPGPIVDVDPNPGSHRNREGAPSLWDYRPPVWMPVEVDPMKKFCDDECRDECWALGQVCDKAGKWSPWRGRCRRHTCKRGA